MAKVHSPNNFFPHQGWIIFGTHLSQDGVVFFPVKIEVFWFEFHLHGFLPQKKMVPYLIT
jgi:hypothetical protein